MGIYKNVTAIYGRNKEGRRVVIGLNVNGFFYKGIKSTEEIPTSKKPYPRTNNPNDPNRARKENKTYKDDVMKTGAGPKTVSKPVKPKKLKR